MLTKKLQNFLDSHHVNYRTIPHIPAYTAMETAQKTHIPGREVAKTVIVKINGELAMAVLPSDCNIDFKEMREELHTENIQLATEDEFKERFPDCEVGGMPPFGNLYDMRVYVSKELAEDEQISFNGGNHSELVQLDYNEFARWVNPKIGQFAIK